VKAVLRAAFAGVLRDLDVARAMAPAIAAIRRDVTAAGLLVLAFGKAARSMAQAVVDGLPGLPLRGLVVTPAPDDAPLPPLLVIAAGHPVPDANSLRAGARALELARSARPGEAVAFLVSGGGSAMLEAPLDAAMTLDELRRLHRALVASGADIVAVNTVRKHLSAVKGGRLALAAAAARVHWTLELRDVPQRPGAAVASGPSTVDPSTPADCCAVLDRFALWSAVPARLHARLRAGDLPPGLQPAAAGSLPRHHLLVGSEQDARAAMLARLRRSGMLVVADGTTDDWPYERAAGHLLRRLERLQRRHPGRVVALVTTGELAVPLPPDAGTGGRNQQFALACARRIRGRAITVLSCGTDGTDGNSPAAGAVVDGATMARARARGLDVHAALRRCDAFPLLQALGDAVVTGPTGTNVRDLRVLVHAR
jgi:hydroxypyruvate reductase